MTHEKYMENCPSCGGEHQLWSKETDKIAPSCRFWVLKMQERLEANWV